MYTWDNAQAFAKKIVRNNAFNKALLCVGTKALFKIDYRKDSDTPVGEFISSRSSPSASARPNALD